jgi:hypothetical protein
MSVMRRFSTVAILALAGLTGCGTEEDNYKLVKVVGTVTRNDKPLSGATVSFLPAPGNQNSTPGTDKTGPDGNYMLKYKGRTGVTPGKYKVLIIEPTSELAGAKIPDEFERDPVMLKLRAERRAERNRGKRGATRLKADAGKSEFDADVEQGPSVTLDFDVKVSSSSINTTAKN